MDASPRASVRSRDIVRIARQRAGLTQAQLAARSGRPRETIARWETGVQEPSLAALRDIVAACDLDLVVHLARRDTSLYERTREQLSLEPVERLRRLLPAETSRDATRVLRWLGQTKTPSIVIGPIAAALQGGAQRPDDGHVDVVSADALSMENEMRADNLVPLDVEDRWRDVDARAPWNLPDGGTVVLASNVPGTRDFPDLRRSALPFEMERGERVLVAHPRDLLRMADASERESERAHVPALRVLLSEVS